MDQKSSNMSIAKTFIVAGVLFILLIISIAFGVSPMGFRQQGDPTPYGDSGIQASGGKGCYLKDEAFTDIGAINDLQTVFDKIGSKYSVLNNAKNKGNLQKIITSSVQEGINPAILISFYFGEQTFNQTNDYKAFGCGHYSKGGSDSGFDNQLTCALPIIKKAINNQPLYDTPKGADRWDRLLYHYVAAARKASYDKYGYVSDDKELRIKLLNDLVPEQVACQAQTTGGTGDKAPSYVIKKIQQSWYSAMRTGDNAGKPVISKGALNVSGIVLHYTAGSDMNSAIKHMGDVGSFVHMIVDTNGTAYQLLPLNDRVSSGSGDANTFAIGIEIVGKDEDALLADSKQKSQVIQLVNDLIKAYNIPNVPGNPENLAAIRGIFGHFQTQSKDGGSWLGTATMPDGRVVNMKKGCQSRKADPGIQYMKDIWSAIPGLNVNDACTTS